MSCNGCTEVSNCNDECTGCLYQLTTNCIVLEKKLSCFSKPIGTDMSVILEEICSTLQNLPAKNVTVDFTKMTDCYSESEIEDFTLQDVLEATCDAITEIQSSISALNAGDIGVTALSCIDSSDVSGSDLQSTLEDLCDVIIGMQTDIEDIQDDIADLKGEADWFVSGTTTQASSIADEIYTNGKVGINTTTPVKVLDVVGDFSVKDGIVYSLVDSTGFQFLGVTPADMTFLYGEVDIAPSSQISAILGKEGYVAMVVDVNGTSNYGIINIDAITDPLNPEINLSITDGANSSSISILPSYLNLATNDLQINGASGDSGSFIAGAKTITVTKGIITSIV